jgi:hypothetical protein
MKFRYFVTLSNERIHGHRRWHVIDLRTSKPVFKSIIETIARKKCDAFNEGKATPSAAFSGE